MDHLIRVLIVEGDDLLRQTIRTWLENSNDITAIGEAKDGQGTIDLARELQPDVILLDADTLRSDGLQTQMVAQIGELCPGSRIIMLSTHGQEHLVLDALREGAEGHLVKRQGQPREIVEAIRTVSRGGSILSPRMAGRILEEITRRDKRNEQ